ncbi:hypothetical protein E2C01_054180 [Portunus trituberculatus]|uniref:Uncharacterized protein n=1 Tax=Portunus trituberculatus TaxID=210409 RepID=A0A5B7GMK5_PORTR|nr:hypothetical protein [Portunus trituberculatus]
MSRTLVLASLGLEASVWREARRGKQLLGSDSKAEFVPGRYGETFLRIFLRCGDAVKLVNDTMRTTLSFLHRM